MGWFFMKKVDNFLRILSTLRLVPDERYLDSKIILLGCVNTYCLTFELAWKAMKEILQDQGVGDAKTGSPKQILELAYRFGMVSEEGLWLEMLKERNNEAHIYNEQSAIELCEKCPRYITVFGKLEEKIKEMGYK